MITNKTLNFSLHLSQQEFLQFYQGTAKSVRVEADSGQVIEFPAEAIRQFVEHSGVHGQFRIYFDANYKLIKITRQP